jgi:hypothetical protein
MEVIVQAEKGLTPPADTFVSLRVGQVQRHARFAPTRSYRFDSINGASAKEPVKLEVFKRIGHTTVTLGGTTGDIQDVEVPVTEGETMRMRLSTANPRASTPAGTEKKKSRSINNARGYLAQHNIEDLIKDAMKELMNVRPGNPHEFLAAYILGAGSSSPTAFLPKIRGAAGKEGVPMPGAKQLAPDAASGKVEKFVPQPRILPPIDGRTPTVQLTWKPTTTLWRHQPSVGTWSMLKPRPAPYREFQLRPSVGTWCTAIVKEPEVVEVPEYRSFKLRPSVGTWVQPLPEPEVTEVTSYRKFTMRPSVGTWCMPKQHRSLEELTCWQPGEEEREAMNVILKGRMQEVRDLSMSLREVSSSLVLARSTGSSDIAELESTQMALERCVAYAQNEYTALEQWGQRRGLSPPTSPIMAYRDV